jgi:hypothetical protein
VLVLGDGIETDLYVGLARRVAALLDRHDLQVVFRPHPLERARVRQTFGDRIDDIPIDMQPNIYDSFVQAKAVISEVSTGLFEAIGLAQKVFIWDTAKARFAYPSHPFQGFRDATDLVAMIISDRHGCLDASDTDSVWAPLWRQNYEEFLRQALD